MLHSPEHDDRDGLDEDRPAICFHPECQAFVNDVPGEFRWVGDRLYCRECGDKAAALEAKHQQDMDDFNRTRR